MFAQLCEMSNDNAWDTDKAVLVGLGNGTGGNGGLQGMTGSQGVNSAWVQDPNLDTWAEFLGSSSSPRKQIVLLDKDLNKRYQFGPYGGDTIGDNGEEGAIEEILAAIEELISEMSILQGDMNEDQILNVQDIIIIVNIILGSLNLDLNGDMNNDGGLNIQDIILLTNIIINNE